MKTFLIVGIDFSELKQALVDHGHDYIVLKDEKKAKNLDKKMKKRVLCDFSSKESILSAVDTIKQPIDAVMTSYENYVLASAWIAEHLGVPGMPVEAALACTDKELMRQAFATAPEPISPASAAITDEAFLRSFAEEHGFPLIIKPANLSKSLLVSKAENLDELLHNYRTAMAEVDRVYKKYAPGRQPKLLVEEFMEGSIHSIDAFIDNDGEPQLLDHVVDYLSGYDIGFADNFHYARLLPSSLSTDDQQKLKHVARLGCKALGMRNSPAHIEIIMTTKGPRIVEIGARNGGYRTRMHKMANDLDLFGIAFSTYLGHPDIPQNSRVGFCAVLELFPRHKGIFTEVKNEEQLKKLASLKYYAIKQPLGEVIGSSSDGYKMAVIIILSHIDEAAYRADLEWVNSQVEVVTR